MNIDELAPGLRADQIIGMEVRSSDDKIVGEVRNIVFGTKDRRDYAIVASGGFFTPARTVSSYRSSRSRSRRSGTASFFPCRKPDEVPPCLIRTTSGSRTKHGAPERRHLSRQSVPFVVTSGMIAGRHRFAREFAGRTLNTRRWPRRHHNAVERQQPRQWWPDDVHLQQPDRQPDHHLRGAAEHVRRRQLND